MDNNMIGIDSPDASLYRIFSKARFFDLIRRNKNGLVNPRKWEDPFENFFLRARALDHDGSPVSLESLADDWYGQCWTLNDDTDAMWRIYSHNKDGIKIKTTVRKLFKSFFNASDAYASLKYFIGKVSYKTEADITKFMSRTRFEDIALGGQATGFAEILCIKREAFSHEAEVRLLYQDTDPKIGNGGLVLFDFDLNTVGDEVVVDPRLSDKDAEILIQEIKMAGCTLDISRSTLYRAPSFTIVM